MSVMMTTCSIQGVVGATTLVLATTLDDCVWLIPFVVVLVSQSPPHQLLLARLHAFTFVVTLVTLTTLICIGTNIIGMMWIPALLSTNNEKVVDKSNKFDVILGGIGAALCWVIAAYFICKRWRKKQQRQQKQDQQLPILSSIGDDNVHNMTIAEPQREKNDYKSISQIGSDQGEDHTSTSLDESSSPKIYMVISLTLLGFSDEVAYFPSLLLGHVFSEVELIVGTFLSGCIMIAIVTLALAPCRPIIEWLDIHIKLWMVVTAFAVLLTIQVMVDIMMNSQD
jgi:cadmium resistance protein CadD (predicted permease)